jgi:hypothetical protein
MLVPCPFYVFAICFPKKIKNIKRIANIHPQVIFSPVNLIVMVIIVCSSITAQNDLVYTLVCSSRP